MATHDTIETTAEAAELAELKTLFADDPDIPPFVESLDYELLDPQDPFISQRAEPIARHVVLTLNAADRHARSALQKMWEAGYLLLQAKARLGHGNWLPFLAMCDDLHERTAQRYMTIARDHTYAEAGAHSSFRALERSKAPALPEPEPEPEPVAAVREWICGPCGNAWPLDADHAFCAFCGARRKAGIQKPAWYGIHHSGEAMDRAELLHNIDRCVEQEYMGEAAQWLNLVRDRLRMAEDPLDRYAYEHFLSELGMDDDAGEALVGLLTGSHVPAPEGGWPVPAADSTAAPEHRGMTHTDSGALVNIEQTLDSVATELDAGNPDGARRILAGLRSACGDQAWLQVLEASATRFSEGEWETIEPSTGPDTPAEPSWAPMKGNILEPRDEPVKGIPEIIEAEPLPWSQPAFEQAGKMAGACASDVRDLGTVFRRLHMTDDVRAAVETAYDAADRIADIQQRLAEALAVTRNVLLDERNQTAWGDTRPFPVRIEMLRSTMGLQPTRSWFEEAELLREQTEKNLKRLFHNDRSEQIGINAAQMPDLPTVAGEYERFVRSRNREAVCRRGELLNAIQDHWTASYLLELGKRLKIDGPAHEPYVHVANAGDDWARVVAWEPATTRFSGRFSGDADLVWPGEEQEGRTDAA